MARKIVPVLALILAFALPAIAQPEDFYSAESPLAKEDGGRVLAGDLIDMLDKIAAGDDAVEDRWYCDHMWLEPIYMMDCYVESQITGKAFIVNYELRWMRGARKLAVQAALSGQLPEVMTDRTLKQLLAIIGMAHGSG